ncbi:MAG: cytochrome c [Alphaproteobacteria bacterium]|jgi:mono/diheme cytochrome c family protein|nr:cytochrome c [Alphaproteobacteria bacterium]
MALRTLAICGAAVVIGGAAFAWLTEGPDVAVRDLSGLSGDVNRGAYVARLSGCIACHTDAKNGGAVLAGGPEIATEFGSFYAPNITPHPEDGIGRWTLNDFSLALTAGRSPAGEHYFPALPYPFYTRLSDQDVVDLWAAVQSVPAVADGPPAHGLRFPFGWHRPVGFWKRLYLDPDPLPPVDGKSETWQRGRYLAEAAAHCGACHTPRTLIGGRDLDRKFEGGVGPGDEKIPPITPDALEREGWTADELRYALRTGLTPSGDSLGGSMAEVIREGTRYWSDADIAALVEYLMDPEKQR